MAGRRCSRQRHRRSRWAGAYPARLPESALLSLLFFHLLLDLAADRFEFAQALVVCLAFAAGLFGSGLRRRVPELFAQQGGALRIALGDFLDLGRQFLRPGSGLIGAAGLRLASGLERQGQAAKRRHGLDHAGYLAPGSMRLSARPA